MKILRSMTRGIRDQFIYTRRIEKGVQPPEETLRNRRGSCRDFAVLFAEAVKNMLAKGINTFIEVGPHAVLRTYLNDALKENDLPGKVISTLSRNDDSPQRVWSANCQHPAAPACPRGAHPPRRSSHAPALLRRWWCAAGWAHAVGDELVIIRTEEFHAAPTIGSTLHVTPRPGKVHHFDAASGKRVEFKP